MRLIGLGVLVLFSSLFARSQKDVELVVSTGMEFALAVAVSHDNKMVAKQMAGNVSIWDVVTGRMIRNVAFSDNNQQSCDSIWFSEDDSKVIINQIINNDTYEVDVETGKSTFVKGPPRDWATYKYTMSNYSKAASHLYSADMSNLEFSSPDGQKKVVFKKIKNKDAIYGMMEYIYQVRVKNGRKMSEPLAETMSPYYAFSPDSRFLFIEQSVFDLEKMREVSHLKVSPYSGVEVGFIPGTHLPVTCGVETVRIWDFPNIVDIPVENLTDFKWAPGYRYMVAEQMNEQKDKEYSVIDIVDRKVMNTIKGKKFKGYLLHVAKDAERFTFFEQGKTTGENYQIKYTSRTINAKSGKEEREIDNSYKGYFTPDPNVMIVDSSAMYSFKYDLKTKKRSRFPKIDPMKGTYILGMSNDHEYIFGTHVTTKDSSYYVTILAWNSLSGELEFEQEVRGSFALGIQISQDHKMLAVYSSYQNQVNVFDFESGELLHELRGHTNMVASIAFSDDNKRLITGSYDGSKRLWNLETGKPMVSLISTGKKDFAIVNANQYYYATKGAQKLIHFVKGKEIFPFEQFDLKYNRPDIILESLEASNQELIRPFNLAYQKRLRRLGFTEEMLGGEFHLPKVSISNKNQLPLIADKPEVSLMVHGIDSKFKLDRILIRVNGVPLNGKRGISVIERDKQLIKEEFPVRLSKGVNRIAVSVMNEKGVESIATNLDIEYNPTNVDLPELYLITLGVSKYADSKFDLNYAAKDAQDLKNLYEEQHLPFSKVNSYHLANNEVNVETIKDLKNKLKGSKEDDVVCLFFAGHGLLDEDLNYFLASYDVDFKDPAKGGIPYDLFEDLVDGIPARRKLVMIDACHSGEIDKEEVAWAEEDVTKETEEENLTFRAVTTTGFKQVGLENSFELMRELFTDIRKSSGALIISSAGGTEYAMEGGEWNNGVFTFCLLDGLKSGKADLNQDGQVMAGEVNEFIRAEVSRLTNGRQTPTNRAEILENDWRMW
ncbi:MAG: caspase family protein [Flavobacteriales bacterium]|nr:caspase family protein [Flavobacteriales bacterium]